MLLVRLGMVHACSRVLQRLCMVLLLSRRLVHGRRRVTSRRWRSTSVVHLRSRASGRTGVWRRHQSTICRGLPVASIIAVLARTPTFSVRRCLPQVLLQLLLRWLLVLLLSNVRRGMMHVWWKVRWWSMVRM